MLMNSLCFVAGTPAELIKMWPVMRRAEHAGAPWSLLFTGQTPVGALAQWREFALPAECLDVLVDRDQDLRVAREAVHWFARANALGNTRLRKLVRCGTKSRIVVQGDTLSTLLGATFGVRLRIPVAHIEAGLRTGSMLEPFPEEVSRRAVSRIARMHFAPEVESYAALLREHTKGIVHMTGGNTSLDALDEARSTPVVVDLPRGDFGIVNLHRFETLISEERKASVRKTLLRASETHQLQIVNHATTRAWLDSEPAFTRDLERNGAAILPRQSFLRFVAWLSCAKFVICDSGGNQEECDYLGKPCLLMRLQTERPVDPARRCVVLSKFDEDCIQSFIADPTAYAEPPRMLKTRPSDLIWEALATF